LHGLQPIDWLVVALSMLAMLGMGVYFSRRQHSAEDYFVAGRRMPWLAVGLSTLATLTSTITYLALPGEMIKNGVGYFTGYVSMPFILAFVVCVSLPFLMRLRLTSAYEYLERRFDYRARLLGAGIFGCIVLGWMATVIYTASNAMVGMTGWKLNYVILFVGTIAIAYTTMGGIRADIWTDVAQAVIMLVGALFAIGYVAIATQTGPLDWWNDAAQVQHTATPLFSLDPTVRVSTVGVGLSSFFWTICTINGSQVAMQRFFTMSSVKAAQRSYVVNIVADVILLVLLGLCGIALFSFFHRQPHLLGSTLNPRTGEGAEKVFPHFIANQLPPAMGGLLIAALFAAAMSTLDSGVNSLSAVLTVDVFRRRGRVKGDRDELRLARVFTVIFGAVITFAAMGVGALKGKSNTIIDILPAAFNWGVGPMGGMFFAGMFLPRCTGRAVIPAAVIGAMIGLGTALLKPVFGVPFTFAWVIPYSCLTTFLLAWALSLFEPHGKDEPLTWRNVVNRPEEFQQ
jgi:SSS family solute:Na+ symporter